MREGLQWETMHSVVAPEPSPVLYTPALSPTGPTSALDVVLGASTTTIYGVLAVTERAYRITRPFLRIVLKPPLLAPNYQPATWLNALARLGTNRRQDAMQDLSQLLDAVVPVLLAEMLRRIDLTAIIQRYVDVDAIVADVDIDAAASRIDVDAIASRLDVDAVVSRLDLTALVRDNVDLDAVVAGVNIDAIAARLDVNAVAQKIDLDAIINRLDLAGLAEQVIDTIDLPEIIRESSGSLAFETVRGARMQGIAADAAVSRALDRLLLRHGRGARGTADPPPPEGEVPT
jgi:hypothetical protein